MQFPLRTISLFLEWHFAKAIAKAKHTSMCLNFPHELFNLHWRHSEIDTAGSCSSKVSAVFLYLLPYHVVRADIFSCSFCEFLYSCDVKNLCWQAFSHATHEVVFPFLFLQGKLSIKVLATTPRIFDAISCQLRMAFGSMVNNHAHALVHHLQHGLLLPKVSAVSKQVSKAGIKFKWSHGILPSMMV